MVGGENFLKKGFLPLADMSARECFMLSIKLAALACKCIPPLSKTFNKGDWSRADFVDLIILGKESLL